MIQPKLFLILSFIIETTCVERFSNFRLFDLTHSLNPTDPIFPGLTPFNFTQKVARWRTDQNNQSYFQSLNSFISAEHFGTHIDAPCHGSINSWTLTDIPFDRLVSIQALIVDVSKKTRRNKNYGIQISDLNEKSLKQATGYFVLLFYTGKSKSWPDQDDYAGGSTREDLDFPGLTGELAAHLVGNYSKKLVGVGIDTLSIDPGSSRHFEAHRILFQANIYALENVANLDSVLNYLSSRRETFFTLDILPMKIQGGTGAPCRIVARLDDVDRVSTGGFGFLIFLFLLLIVGIIAKTVYDLKFNPNAKF